MWTLKGRRWGQSRTLLEDLVLLHTSCRKVGGVVPAAAGIPKDRRAPAVPRDPELARNAAVQAETLWHRDCCIKRT